MKTRLLKGLVGLLFLLLANDVQAQTDQWSWVKGDTTINNHGIYGTQGIGNPLNKPGGRFRGMGSIDKSGNLWLFGGSGFGAYNTDHECLNDLWRFNSSLNQWTWMKGSYVTYSTGFYGTQGTGSSITVPSARYNSANWTDSSGNLWIFGGIANDNTMSFP